MRILALLILLIVLVSAATQCAPRPAGPGGMPGDWEAGEMADPDDIAAQAPRIVPSPLFCDDPTCGCRRFAGPHCEETEECTCPPWDRVHVGRMGRSGK